jgi:CubicO group peptidase (beta-lactamase class C family)
MRRRRSRFLVPILVASIGACGEHRPSPTAPTAADPRSASVAALVSAYHDAGQFDGVVLVADGGRIIYRGAFGLANREWNIPNTLDSRFEIASMTKPMTAIAVLQLVDENKLRLDAAVADYIPYFRAAPGAKITIEQLLAHTSGLQQDIAFVENGDDPGVAARINADELSLDEIVKLIAARPLRFPPGTDYAYSSDGYAVLGAVIERLTGKSYADAIDERVLRKAGMTSTVPALLTPLVPQRVTGYQQTWATVKNAPHIGASPAGGFYSTVGDLYAWERALAGDALLSPKMKQLVFAKRDVITAYGWKTREEHRRGRDELIVRTTGGLPGFVHVLERIPDEDRVVIALCNIRGPVYYLDKLVTGIHAALDGAKPEPPRRSAAIAAAANLGGGAGAIRGELDRMAADPDHFYVDETEINSLGYHVLLARKDPPVAVAILAFNAARFPSSVNVYDSLGEAELAAGDRDAAIGHYRKVLELDPQNVNAKKVLDGLGVPVRP